MLIRQAAWCMVGMISVLIGGVGVFAVQAERRDVAEWRSLEFGRSLVAEGAPERFVRIEYDQIPSAVRVGSENQVALRLRREARPLSSEEFVVRLAAAVRPGEDDIIEYRWRFSGLELRLLESINAFDLQIELDRLASEGGVGRGTREELARVASLVKQVVRTQGRDGHGETFQLEIPWDVPLENGVAFSSNPEKSIIKLRAWHERVDLFVSDDVLHVLMYQKIRQLPLYRDGSVWFTEDLRQLIRQNARSKDGREAKSPEGPE